MLTKIILLYAIFVWGMAFADYIDSLANSVPLLKKKSKVVLILTVSLILAPITLIVRVFQHLFHKEY